VLVEAGLAAAESALSAPLAARAEERVRGELAAQRARHDRAAAAAAREAAAAAAAVAAAARAKAKARARARWGRHGCARFAGLATPIRARVAQHVR
jgi:hypothetical protein